MDKQRTFSKEQIRKLLLKPPKSKAEEIFWEVTVHVQEHYILCFENVESREGSRNYNRRTRI